MGSQPARLGLGAGMMLFSHIIPISLTPLIVQGNVWASHGHSGLGCAVFLGLGRTTAAEWLDARRGTQQCVQRAASGVLPGIAIMLTVLGFNRSATACAMRSIHGLRGTAAG